MMKLKTNKTLIKKSRKKIKIKRIITKLKIIINDKIGIEGFN